jgi:hypothetical protein
VAVAALALGIGVNTAIFSLVDQLPLWSVPALRYEQAATVRCLRYPLVAAKPEGARYRIGGGPRLTNPVDRR